jgi:hypothetical protein
VGLGGKKRVKNMPQVFGPDTDAVIGDINGDLFFFFVVGGPN